MSSVVFIAAAAHREIVAHCRDEFPREAVGLLGGRDGIVEDAYRLANIAPATGGLLFFLADPYRQFLAERAIVGAGKQVVGMYHSHPGGTAVLSREDIVACSSRIRLQIVVALAGGKDRPVLRAYRAPSDTSIPELAIRLV